MMNAIETRRYEMLVRVQEYGAKYAQGLAPGTLGADLFAEVGAAVERLAAHSAAKATGAGTAREGSANRRLMRETLRDNLEMLRRTARTISEVLPNVGEKFRLPATERDQALLDAARSFAAEAAPLRAEFERHGLGAEFFARLEASTAALERALATQRRGRDTRMSARTAIGEALSAGLKAVRRLDTVVANLLGTDPVAMQAWSSARRIQGTARGGRNGQNENGGGENGDRPQPAGSPEPAGSSQSAGPSHSGGSMPPAGSAGIAGSPASEPLRPAQPEPSGENAGR